MWFVQPDSYSSAILAACTDSATMNTSPDMSNKSSMLTSSFSRLENSSSTSLSSSSLSERLNNSGKSSCTFNLSSTDTKFEQREDFPSRSSSATASSNQSDSSSSLPSGFSVPTTSWNQSAPSSSISSAAHAPSSSDELSTAAAKVLSFLESGFTDDSLSLDFLGLSHFELKWPNSPQFQQLIFDMSLFPLGFSVLTANASLFSSSLAFPVACLRR